MTPRNEGTGRAQVVFLDDGHNHRQGTTRWRVGRDGRGLRGGRGMYKLISGQSLVTKEKRTFPRAPAGVSGFSSVALPHLFFVCLFFCTTFRFLASSGMLNPIPFRRCHLENNKYYLNTSRSAGDKHGTECTARRVRGLARAVESERDGLNQAQAQNTASDHGPGPVDLSTVILDRSSFVWPEDVDRAQHRVGQ